MVEVVDEVVDELSVSTEAVWDESVVDVVGVVVVVLAPVAEVLEELPPVEVR